MIADIIIFIILLLIIILLTMRYISRKNENKNGNFCSSCKSCPMTNKCLKFKGKENQHKD